MSDYIAHHGIPGQKWGKRNGPPYPLNESDKSSSEKHAEIISRDKKGLTDAQKKALLIAGAAVGAGLAAYGAYKVAPYIKDSYLGGEVGADGVRRINGEHSIDEDLSQINPGRIKWLSTTKNREIISGSSCNCMLCTTAYDLRRRGYDVHAGFSKTGFALDDLNNFYKNVNIESYGSIGIDPDGRNRDNVNILLNHLESYGDGARGNICVQWSAGGGHSMIWEIIDGKACILDGQINKKYESYEEITKLFSNTDWSRMVQYENYAGIARLDNVALNKDVLFSNEKYSHGFSNDVLVNKDTVFKTLVDHGGDISIHALTSPEAIGLYIGAYKYGSEIIDAIDNAKEKAKKKKNKKNVSDKS